MKIVNEKLLARMRLPGLCESCGRPCPDGRDPHHVMTKGAGRVDAECNLVSICRLCHVGFHTSGKPSYDELIAIAGRRTGKTPEEIEEFVWRMRREDKADIWRLGDGEEHEDH